MNSNHYKYDLLITKDVMGLDWSWFAHFDAPAKRSLDIPPFPILSVDQVNSFDSAFTNYYFFSTYPLFTQCIRR
jgi:hypothetical protein